MRVLCENTCNELVWVERSTAEKATDGTRQIIPGAVLIVDKWVNRYHDEYHAVSGKIHSSVLGRFVLAYDRCGAETRLHNKTSVIIGGHVDEPDVFPAESLVRELADEAGLNVNLGKLKIKLQGAYRIDDTTTQVGSVHSSRLVRLHIKSEHYCKNPFYPMDKEELNRFSDEISNPRWLPLMWCLREAERPDTMFELWSKIALLNLSTLPSLNV